MSTAPHPPIHFVSIMLGNTGFKTVCKKFFFLFSLSPDEKWRAKGGQPNLKEKMNDIDDMRSLQTNEASAGTPYTKNC